MYKFNQINLLHKSEITDNIPELHYNGWWGCHTFEILVPTDTYFDEHPEYYSKRCGHRLKEKTQLCLTNPELVSVVADRLIDFISKNPQYDVYDLSQNDNTNYCKCPECRRAVKKYGQSGVLLNFVNQVARKIKQVYPDKLIGTFAYQYTREIPKDRTIVPNDNVIVRLCNIECCFSHPLNSKECCKNKQFIKDFKDWRNIAPRLAIWDYTVNYWNTYGPFPNLDAIYENVKMFYEMGCQNLLSEGCYYTYGELNELRAHILKTSFENPYHNLNKTINDFIESYYGPYSSLIKEYVDDLRHDSLPFYKKHFKSFVNPWSIFLKHSFLKKYVKKLNIFGTDIYADRVNFLFMGVGLTYCWRYKYCKLSKEIYPKVKSLLLKNGVTYWREGENYRIEDFFDEME